MHDANIKEKKLVNQSDISNLLTKNYDLNTKLATLAIKTELKAEQYKIVKLQLSVSSYFCSKGHFDDDDTQNYCVAASP